ncbi:MAG: GTP 3',8-cyclase MoaA [Dehalococcoidales bacterium]|nr:GTP 3',8-cyclase MoaA [Dehalococcoidales bacterium]
MTKLADSFQRTINYLRISVTDRCNLRCIYCMPPEGIVQMTHADILTYEEIFILVKAAAELGINSIRLTGGEPLVRMGLSDLVRMIAGIKTIKDIALTTNGILLEKYAAELKDAGLTRVNISLDTLKPARFHQITRCGELEDTLKGIAAAEKAGLTPVKINMVVMAGTNDDELVDFAKKTIDDGWNVRFIEHMPVTGEGSANDLIPAKEIKKRLDVLGKMEPFKLEKGNGPAKYYKFPGAKGTVGFITPVTEHFCYQCNRLRLTADGKLRLCLLREDEIDLREPLRRGASTEELKEIIAKATAAKPKGHQLAEGIINKGRPFSQVGG